MGFHGLLADTEIVLELQLNSTPSMSVVKTMKAANNKPTPSFDYCPLEPSLTLAISGYSRGGAGSVGSSISNVSVKREREVASDESERGLENMTTSGEDCDHQEYDELDGGVMNARKKLRLTKVQSGLLEKAFKLDTTLNLQKQKQELAKDLKLRPRQVEVWFQNRRARTKLKQTEVDCENLKRRCKTLTDENKRLRQEVQALKAQKVVSHHANPAACTCSHQLRPPSPCVIRSSCERTGNITSATSTNGPFAMAAAAKPHHLLNPFTSSSAAC